MSGATMVRRLTPVGRGGVGTTLLAGPEALVIFARFFTLFSGRNIDADGTIAPYQNRPLFGYFALTGNSGASEQVVVHIESRERVEIHAHGGEAVLAAIRSALLSAGAVEPAFENDPAENEPLDNESFAETAARLLPLAKTETAAKILLDQLNGASDRLFAEVQAGLETLRLITDGASRLEMARTLRDRLDRTLALGRCGCFLIEPPRVVLAGPVNAGKSSLLNGLLGFDRALTNPEAGTTRDAIAAETAFDGFPVRLFDTAGLRATSHAIEREGIRRTKELLARADLILAVFDLSGDIAKDQAEFRRDLELLPPCSDRQMLIVGNKSDLAADFTPLEDSGGIAVCAFDAASMERLAERILATLVPTRPEPGEAVPLTNAQVARWRTFKPQISAFF